MTESHSTLPILIVDDEAPVLKGLSLTLRTHGFSHIQTCQDSREVIGLVEKQEFALLLLDLSMPHIRGEELLKMLIAQYPYLTIIVITAENDLNTAVHCMKMGATDYLLKPTSPEVLIAAIHRALNVGALRYENNQLRRLFSQQQPDQPDLFAEIITSNPSMLRVFCYIEAVSRGAHPVLISGETGTGKELAAKALHKASGRSGPFIAVNTAGLNDELFTDTLFGHKAGAFTGASKDRKGLMEQAANGTLFLDEIGELSELAQIKLLRVLQEREFYPLGSDKKRTLKARVLTATHKDPALLRQDLYYRLRGYHIQLPPLRQRPEDLPLLFQHFLELAAKDLKCPTPTIPDEILPTLQKYPFPGNIRELQSMLFHAVADKKNGQLDLQSFLDLMQPDARPSPRTKTTLSQTLQTSPLTQILSPQEFEDLDRNNILRALELSHWRIAGKGGAAELLKLKPTTLASRMKKYGLQKKNPPPNPKKQRAE